MKYLKTIDIINLLKSQGHEVSYKKRTDGGYQITEINGRKFSGSKGNTIGRQITGTPLPQKLLKQRIKITKARESKYKKISSALKQEVKNVKKIIKKYDLEEKTPYKNRRELLQAIEKDGLKAVRKSLKPYEKFDKMSKSFKEQFEKTKQAINTNENIKGKISVSITLKSVQQYGIREVKRKLKSMELYAEGFAREGNLYWFCERLREIEKKFQTDKLESVIKYVMTHQIKDKNLKSAYDIIYLMDKGEIAINDTSAKMLINFLTA